MSIHIGRQRRWFMENPEELGRMALRMKSDDQKRFRETSIAIQKEEGMARKNNGDIQDTLAAIDSIRAAKYQAPSENEII